MFSGLIPPSFRSTIRSWIDEDIPSFDYSGFVVGNKPDVALIYAKAPGVLAGVPFVNMICEETRCEISWEIDEGEFIDPKGLRVVVARVTGLASDLLVAERTALNLLARCSGIATRARILKNIAISNDWRGSIAATRKTTPGFRLVEKYGVLVGGCDAHRMDLSSMVMLKDNAIVSTGSITAAVAKARSAAGFSVKIEVECGNGDQAREAISAGADVVMLDNLEPSALGELSATLRSEFSSSNHRFLIEASGGITLENVAAYMHPSVDVISLGALTQGVPHIDYSMKIQPPTSSDL